MQNEKKTLNEIYPGSDCRSCLQPIEGNHDSWFEIVEVKAQKFLQVSLVWLAFTIRRWHPRVVVMTHCSRCWFPVDPSQVPQVHITDRKCILRSKESVHRNYLETLWIPWFPVTVRGSQPWTYLVHPSIRVLKLHFPTQIISPPLELWASLMTHITLLWVMVQFVTPRKVFNFSEP